MNQPCTVEDIPRLLQLPSTTMADRSKLNSLRSCSRGLNSSVKLAISQLTGNVGGCTIQSILAKLRRRPKGHGITWMQVKKAVDCLLEYGVVMKLKKGYFADSFQYRRSAAKAQMRDSTKTASAVIRASRSTAAKLKPPGVKLGSSNALWVRPGGRKSRTAIRCTCNIPGKDDRDTSPPPTLHRQVTSGKTDDNLGDNSLEDDRDTSPPPTLHRKGTSGKTDDNLGDNSLEDDGDTSRPTLYRQVTSGKTDDNLGDNSLEDDHDTSSPLTLHRQVTSGKTDDNLGDNSLEDDRDTSPPPTLYRQVTSGKTDDSLGDNSLEASLMHADPAVVRRPSGVDETKTNETDNQESGRTIFTQPANGPDAIPQL